jgi:hypothetical protein
MTNAQLVVGFYPGGEVAESRKKKLKRCQPLLTVNDLGPRNGVPDDLLHVEHNCTQEM